MADSQGKKDQAPELVRVQRILQAHTFMTMSIADDQSIPERQGNAEAGVTKALVLN